MASDPHSLSSAVLPIEGRKLIAVVYADMVGYSRLIGLDDADTCERLLKLRRDLIDPALARHGGTLAQTGGDSLLATFESIISAVRFAVDVQRGVPEFDGDYPADRRMRFRMSVNVGDVIPEGTNLHGDGVNIAARLQTAARLAQFVFPRVVRDQVGNRLGLGFKELGAVNFKNIARPIEAFLLELAPSAPLPPLAAPRKPWRRLVPVLGAALICVVAVAGVFGLARMQSRSNAPQSPAVEAPLAKNNLPPLSIAVLPFDNLSGRSDDEYLANGITDDLTSDLSVLPGMYVIARTSAFTYKNKLVDPRQIGAELNVRYLLQGSMRKSDDSVRVNAQLIDTKTGAQLWADRFDQKLNDLSAGQEEIVRRIGVTLNVAMLDIESARSKRERPTNPDAFDLILRARSIGMHPMGPRENADRIDLFEQALRLDPQSILAMSGLAVALLETGRKGDELDRAARLVAEAATINPNHQVVLGANAYLLVYQRRYNEAILAYQRLLDYYPNAHVAYGMIGSCLMSVGRAEEAVPMTQMSIQRDPRNPYVSSRYGDLGFALLLLRRDEESIGWTQRALAALPSLWLSRRAQFNLRLAAAYARLGRSDEAHGAVAEANRIWPYDTARSHYPDDPSSLVHAAQIEGFQAALRLAGHRDHAEEAADFGVASDDVLHQDIAGLTPMTAPGAKTVLTADLPRLIDGRKLIVIDALEYFWGRSIPGAVGLMNVGWGSSFSDGMQERLRLKMRELTLGDLNRPVVAVSWNSERFDGRNLTLRLVALGYTQVYWYRGGREAWEVNGLPEAKLVATPW